MKKASIFNVKNPFWAILIMALPLLGACQKDGEIDQEGMIDLKDIADNPAFADLPLIGTTWKLIGFGNERSGKIKPAKPEADIRGTYMLVFENQGTISGYTSTNAALGKYELPNPNKGQVTILHFGRMTYINELYDGNKYIDAIREVSKYDITSQGLFLHYSSREYLLFEPKIE